MMLYNFLFCVFFFQAEDGIRDLTVTGVQTCALPISPFRRQHHRLQTQTQEGALVSDRVDLLGDDLVHVQRVQPPAETSLRRSEERRVGKECRSRWSP